MREEEGWRAWKRDLGEEKDMVGALQSYTSPKVVMKVVPPLLLCEGNSGGVLMVGIEVCLFMATEVMEVVWERREVKWCI